MKNDAIILSLAIRRNNDGFIGRSHRQAFSARAFSIVTINRIHSKISLKIPLLYSDF